MPEYRRRYRPGGSFFFTLVTANRARWLCDDVARRLLREAIEQVRAEHPMTIDAFVLLPQHLHNIWTLPASDTDYSLRWAAIKGLFTASWLAAGGAEAAVFPGQARQRRRGVWQPRFIEHTLRDEDDFIQHVEYIHYNPVKHGLVRRPRDWEYSSFHRYVREGHYDINWCCGPSRRDAPSFPRVDAAGFE